MLPQREEDIKPSTNINYNLLNKKVYKNEIIGIIYCFITEFIWT